MFAISRLNWTQKTFHRKLIGQTDHQIHSFEKILPNKLIAIHIYRTIGYFDSRERLDTFETCRPYIWNMQSIRRHDINSFGETTELTFLTSTNYKPTCLVKSNTKWTEIFSNTLGKTCFLDFSFKFSTFICCQILFVEKSDILRLVSLWQYVDG